MSNVFVMPATALNRNLSGLAMIEKDNKRKIKLVFAMVTPTIVLSLINSSKTEKK